MNVNKKLGRFKQWAGERMGGEVKTVQSDGFKTMEAEMTLRCEGLNANHKAMNAYVKTLSKKSEGDDKERIMPVAYLGSTMAHHGEEFETDSEFGTCLIAMGRTQERISRIQESYVAQASSTWLESLERSITQMKEYQAARRKLDSRRLAYDTAQGKLQKARREDLRSEEEVRAQKIKYEEANEDVLRRMQDIQEGEAESLTDLSEFLEAELNYYARCHEALLQLKKEWPTSGMSMNRASTRLFEVETQPSYQDGLKAMRTSLTNENNSSSLDRASYVLTQRPRALHKTTYDSGLRKEGAGNSERMVRTPSDGLAISTRRTQSRPSGRAQAMDGFDDRSDHSEYYRHEASSPDYSIGDGGISPATSVASSVGAGARRKAPPPPPPPRSKKPPPPPPAKHDTLNRALTMN